MVVALAPPARAALPQLPEVRAVTAVAILAYGAVCFLAGIYIGRMP